MSIHHTFVELPMWPDEDVPVKVYYQFYPAREGARDGRRGLKIEPDEPAHIEIDWIEGPSGIQVEIPKAQEDRIIGEIAEDLWEKQHDREPRERDE